MPIIADHHKPDHFWPTDTEYAPKKAWPDNVYVQWGGQGVVLSDAPYNTAFFEAFPKPGSFIRGEGETIEAAEEAAFERYLREHACVHEIGRRGYTNGAGTCTKCGGFFSGAFKPVTSLGDWRTPPSESTLSTIISGWLRHRDGREKENPDCAKHSRRSFLKARTHGIALPETPQETMTSDQFMGYVLDPYRAACREAVADWLAAGGGAHLPDWQIKTLTRKIAGHRASDERLQAKAAAATDL